MFCALYARATRKTSGRVSSILETKLATFGSNAGLSLRWQGGLVPRIPRWKKTEEIMENQKSIKIQVFLGVWFETNFQKPGQPGQPIVGIHLTSIISTARTAWTLAGAIRQNTAGWNPRAYASSAQAGRWNGWNATSLGGNPSIHRPGDRDFRSPHFKNYPKCLDGAKRQRCWASEVHKIHRVRANSHMCTI